MPGRSVPPSSLRSLPHWEEIEVRLRQRWTPHAIVEWHCRQYPGRPQPSERALARFLQSKPTSWFVVSLAVGPFTPSCVPRIFVLREQASLIEVQKLRLNKLLASEHDARHPIAEVRQNIALLSDLYDAHLRAQQAMGLEPAYRRGRRPKPQAPRGLAQDADYYPFLTPGENQAFLEIKERLDRGEIDMVQLFKEASAIFYIENGERPPAEPP